jgi:type I restriction enzyme S subunit
MKLETFFEKFDLFADAPNAVAKMRELVLQLAVRGQLAEQNPEDEPASQALAKITAANSSRRAAKVSNGEDASEVPFAIPDSWKWVRFGDLVQIRTGKLDANAAVEGGAYPFFTCSKTPSTISTYSFDTSAVILAGNGDFNLKSYSGKFDAYQRTYVIEPLGWELGFCFWLMSAQIKRITDSQRGSAIPYLRLGDIADPLVPFPPLAEQKRIVAKVDELMALCDRLEAQQKERETRHAALARASLARFADAPTPANLNFIFHKSYDITPADLRKTILTLAVQGKLVPQDPNDEPALALVDQVADHKAALAKQGKLRGSTAVKPMAYDEAEFELPSNWCWVRFGAIMVNRDGERIPVSKEDRETKAKTYDYYGASGVIDKIDGYLFDKPLLLIGEDGANLINRSTPIAFIARGKYWVNNHAHVLDGISEDFLQFIELHINAINLERYVTGSAQPKMNQAKMNSIPIALPPLAEQRRIVAKVDELMALVDALETELTTARSTAEKLMEAVVAELTATERLPSKTQRSSYEAEALSETQAFGRSELVP